MKILGYTDQDEYIICVSKQEWESISSGIMPQSDATDRWLKTEVFIGLSSKKLKGINWRCLLTPFRQGEIDGTWESLAEFLEKTYFISHIGDRGRAKLIEITEEFKAKNQR